MPNKEFLSFYKKASGGEGERCNYATRLDPYGCGCQHDCSYCYAKSLLDFRHLWNAEHPSVANIEKIERVIKKIPKGEIIRLGGMTDCFQWVELDERVTYKTIQLLNKYGIGYLIVTKSNLVAKDEYDVDEHFWYWQENVNANKYDCCNLRGGKKRVRERPVEDQISFFNSD